MKLSAPKEVTWWIAVILAVLALLGQVVLATFGARFLGVMGAVTLSPLAFWILLLAFVLLALGNLLESL